MTEKVSEGGQIISCTVHEAWWICKFIAEDNH